MGIRYFFLCGTGDFKSNKTGQKQKKMGKSQGQISGAKNMTIKAKLRRETR